MFQVGDLMTFALFRSFGPLDHIGKRGILTMQSRPNAARKMARQGFGLLLELRERHDADQCLAKALAFLEALAQAKEDKAVPVVFSIRLMPMRKL